MVDNKENETFSPSVLNAICVLVNHTPHGVDLQEHRLIIDGSWRKDDGSASIAWVCYDADEEPIAQRAAQLHLLSAFPAEVIACQRVIQWAKEQTHSFWLMFCVNESNLFGPLQLYCRIFGQLAKRYADESYLTNGYLDTIIDWIPGMKDIRLKDLPTCFQTTNPNDEIFNLAMESAESASQASAIGLHTFNALEQDLLDALSSMFQNVYTIGPLQLLLNQQVSPDLERLGYNLWKEEPKCLQWLDSKEPSSVIYVNFGSVTVMPLQHLIEFAWGLANSNHYFLWVIRPDLVIGESVILAQEFEADTKERGLIAGWCPQEEVLNHPSVGVFLTHSGWNSTIESLTAGLVDRFVVVARSNGMRGD
ncbi:7-deoxyloganetin glucosyltransferase-like [Camellia sinensis]|uniref:7-deoxyloganetin glucosyltransferase-like n=1 Tax=Camellia sinensis TaxID=4442 RepID=UPI00103673EC|nr:7-deoxyloganetin glucosyltransferase-like [Camellia sinensis]